MAQRKSSKRRSRGKRRSRSRRFGSCAPCGMKSFGKRRRRRTRSKRRRRRRSFSRRRRSRFGAFTGGSPNSLLQMEGPAYSYGRRRRRRMRKMKRLFSRRRRRFGNVKGQGFRAQVSYPTDVHVDYFGKPESFINSSSWWYPSGPNGQLQSPHMLYVNK